MTAVMSAVSDAARFAVTAAALLAVDPVTLGGATVRATPALSLWLDYYRSLQPQSAPWRKLPAGVSPARLTGGLDLAASLSAGKPLFERGLLAEADGGVIVAPMGERIEPEAAALLSAALDEKSLRAERDGFSRVDPAQFALVIIDESMSEGESVPGRLSERLAFEIVPGPVADSSIFEGAPDRAAIQSARARISSTVLPDELLEALAAAALCAGVKSVRALRFAAAAARAAAALGGRANATGEDAKLAAALVIAPRALLVPESLRQEAPPPPDSGGASDNHRQHSEDLPIDDQIVAAIRSAIDAGVLNGGLAPVDRARRRQSSGKSGAARKSVRTGRPYGSRQGDLSNGARLALVDTLRAAAPWQKFRGRSDAAPVAIRRDDFRVARLRERRQSLTIFLVDASGSAAMQRLAETKGAIEHLFSRSYSRRDEVALIAFRKSGAELLVPPTRSLARARRLLAALPGGGGTPLAAGIDAACILAAQSSARGRTPTVVLMTDGRANVALNGDGGREAAQRDAAAAARRLRARNIRVLLVDNSMRPEPLAAALAREMGASYLPLPQADARIVAAAITPDGARTR